MISMLFSPHEFIIKVNEYDHAGLKFVGIFVQPRLKQIAKSIPG
jgi:hypothetical protein